MSVRNLSPVRRPRAVSTRGRTADGKPNPVDVHVGARLRLRRTLLGLSQEALGAALGLTFQQVQKYERGANRIGASRLFDAARVLDVPVGFFFDAMPADVAAAGPAAQVSGTAPAAISLADSHFDRGTLDLVRAYRAMPADLQAQLRAMANTIAESQSRAANAPQQAAE